MPDHTIEAQVENLNAQDPEQLGRWIHLHVSRVGDEIPADLIFKRRRRHLAPRALEFTHEGARKMIDLLQKGLDRNLPGTILAVVYGHEEL